MSYFAPQYQDGRVRCPNEPRSQIWLCAAHQPFKPQDRMDQFPAQRGLCTLRSLFVR
jgi:hypothetical protein